MTVRVVVTASGRVTFQGSGYAPRGRGRAGRRRADRRPASRRAGTRTRSRRSREQRERAAAGRTLDRPGRSDRGRAAGGRAQGRPRAPRRSIGVCRASARCPFSSERKLMSTLHRHTEQQDRAVVFTKGAPDVLLARCTFEAVDDDRRPLTDGAPRRDPRRPTKRWPARRCGRSASPRDGCRRTSPAEPDDRARAGSRLRRADRHDRSAAARSARRGRAREARRHPAADDHRRSPAHRRRHRPGARHHGGRPRADRRGAREAVPDERSRPAVDGSVGLRAGQPRAQAAHRQRAAPVGRGRRDDRRRRQRRARP